MIYLHNILICRYSGSLHYISTNCLVPVVPISRKQLIFNRSCEYKYVIYV